MNDILVLLIIALVVVLFIRGPKMLPKIGEALGRGIKETRQEVAKGFKPDGDDGTSPPAP